MARPTSQDEKRAAVEAGMDVLGWTYEDAFWNRWIDQEKRRGGKPSPAFSGQVALVSLAGTAAGVVATASAIAELGICLIGLPIAALSLTAWRLLPRQGYRVNITAAAPSVRITSTGLLFADTAWLWHSDHELLSYAGIGHGDPPFLCFKFRRKRWLGRFDYELDVPLPAAVAEQAEELTREILRYKVSHVDE